MLQYMLAGGSCMEEDVRRMINAVKRFQDQSATIWQPLITEEGYHVWTNGELQV